MDYSYTGINDKEKRFNKVNKIGNYILVIIGLILTVCVMWLLSDFIKKASLDNKVIEEYNITQERKELADKYYQKWLDTCVPPNSEIDNWVEYAKRKYWYDFVNSSLNYNKELSKQIGMTKDHLYMEIKKLGYNIDRNDRSYEDLLERHARAIFEDTWSKYNLP